MDDSDRDALKVLMSYAPAPGEGVSRERHVEVPDLEREHRRQREARERLAADAEWVE